MSKVQESLPAVLSIALGIVLGFSVVHLINNTPVLEVQESCQTR